MTTGIGGSRFQANRLNSGSSSVVSLQWTLAIILLFLLLLFFFFVLFFFLSLDKFGLSVLYLFSMCYPTILPFPRPLQGAVRQGLLILRNVPLSDLVVCLDEYPIPNSHPSLFCLWYWSILVGWVSMYGNRAIITYILCTINKGKLV